MARAAGIQMAACRLLEENGRAHFMTRRFDRLPDGSKLHMQTLGGLAHFDYNMAGAYSYEQAFQVMHHLDLGMDDRLEQFRRMLFNIVARNQDDHVKNIAYLMDKSGQWRLSPAYDIVYSYNTDGAWTSRHQMTVNRQRDNFRLSDFEACAKIAAIPTRKVAEIIDDIQKVVSQWADYADQAGVDPHNRDRIMSTLRLNTFK
jgi:serine/threonine-protein kinase HipA